MQGEHQSPSARRLRVSPLPTGACRIGRVVSPEGDRPSSMACRALGAAGHRAAVSPARCRWVGSIAELPERHIFL